MEIKKLKNGMNGRQNSYMEEHSKVLETSYKDTVSRQKNKFYTPHLTLQKERPMGVYNNYLHNGFSSKGDGNGVLNNKNMNINQENNNKGNGEHKAKENEVSLLKLKKVNSNKKSKAHKKEDINKKKLMKIQALFVANKLETVDIRKIILNWRYLAEICISLFDDKDLRPLMCSYIRNTFPLTLSEFSEAFTSYSGIKNKVHNFFFLQLWSVVLFVYTEDKIKGELRLQLMSWYANIFQMLLKNAFYMSLIMTKAMRNGFVNSNKELVKEFSKNLQTFGFATGVPLIKTLEKNNKQIFLAIKNILNLIDVRLFMQFEKSYLKDLDCLGNCSRRLIFLFKDKIHKSYNESMSVLQFNMKRSLAAVDPKTLQIDRSLLIKSSSAKKYTFVFDLDETLIHFKNDTEKGKFLIRPNAYNILKKLSSHCEVIIFTAAVKEYADWILDKIDQDNSISHRFYREHCLMTHNCHIKDISRLNRDPSKTLIIDNIPENFSLQKRNGICIRSWFGDLEDKALFLLEKILLDIVKQDIDDVRQYIEKRIGNDPSNGLIVLN